MPIVEYANRRYESRPGESVLDTLVRGGANIPFSCRKGSCHTCLLQAVSGDPGADAVRGLRPEMVDSGHFLPCLCTPGTDLVLADPDPGAGFLLAQVAERAEVAPGVVRLRLEPELDLRWRPGQTLNVRNPCGTVRSYSLSSIPDEDYFPTLHVTEDPEGALSPWLCRELRVGSTLEIQGPQGDCTWRDDWRDLDLVLVGTGSGVPPLFGIARDAARSGHRGAIRMVFGARTRAGLIDHEAMNAWAADHPNVAYLPCLSGETSPTGGIRGRVLQPALGRVEAPERTVVILCGHPDMIHEARYLAVLAGIPRERIVADPFDSVHPQPPRDVETLRRIAPDPELWAALDDGRGLRAILEDFYGRVYEDARLVPFFHNVTRDRAIDKQYAFLRDLFSGSQGYLGLRPFNAHHWMVITDELFDYRERLFEDCVRRHGLPEPLVRRWNALHELFRRDIVKSRARGLWMNGSELDQEGFSMESLEVGTLCDGCESEMAPGEHGRMHRRTGKLYCLRCGEAA